MNIYNHGFEGGEKLTINHEDLADATFTVQEYDTIGEGLVEIHTLKLTCGCTPYTMATLEHGQTATLVNMDTEVEWEVPMSNITVDSNED